MPFDVTATLHEALVAHGVEARFDGQGIYIPKSGANFSAEIFHKATHPDTIIVQLDVRATAPQLSNRLLIESCAGWAADEDQAGKTAFSKFMQASLHVLLATLVAPELGSDQVEWEDWTVGQKTFKACLGPVTFIGAFPEGFTCGDLIDSVRDALVPRLSGEVHWLRLFYSSMGGRTIEALLDNNDWPEGRAILDVWNWPKGEYSARVFLMVVASALSATIS